MSDDSATPDADQLTFLTLDEYGFALFVRWLYGGTLHGPKDFAGFTHYLALYCLAIRFGVEDLQDEAPAFRIEYVYTFTPGPNAMRNFLITTAAYRSLCDTPPAPGQFVSDSMKTLVARGGDVAADFAEALVRLSKNGLVDVRKGSDEDFHVRPDGKGVQGLEPYQDP
ncbi:hypothetical protein ANO11243_006500 [Dothideomycetidae sp. 11243]|nr:hypothetical protein ANO11243_006500 [fungal sp. No.11243]